MLFLLDAFFSSLFAHWLCVLCSVFCVLYSVFCVLCSVFCVLCSVLNSVFAHIGLLIAAVAGGGEFISHSSWSAVWVPHHQTLPNTQTKTNFTFFIILGCFSHCKLPLGLSVAGRIRGGLDADKVGGNQTLKPTESRSVCFAFWVATRNGHRQ